MTAIDIAVTSGPELPITADYGSGVVSRRLLKRAAIIYSLVLLAGLAPSLMNSPPGWQAFGLGIVLPGGGLLAVGGWGYAWFVLTLVLMLVACAAWLLMANVLAPLIVWLGSAALAARLATAPAAPIVVAVVPLLAIGFIAWVALRYRRIATRELINRARRNAYLPRAERELLDRAVTSPAVGTRELSLHDLGHLRYALDRGLQPVQSLQGFDVIEQFQTSAVRYQIDYLLWALQMAQCHYTPSFHGYLSQAQRNLIDKLTVPKVWKWWRWESLLGNFSFSRDPIAKDNIMFGGFSSANVALYTANTGDPRYLADGALTFKWSGRRSYHHNLQSMLAAGRLNHAQAAYGPLYPCEPKLTYSACNLWGNFAHIVGDRIFKTTYQDQLVRDLEPAHVSEMLCRDGTVHAGRVTPIGMRIPVYTSNHVTAIWGWMANTFFPVLSRRVWAILREECVRFDQQGEIELATESYDRVDTGNYRKGEAGIHGQFLVLAREHGDEKVAEGILRKLDRDFQRTDAAGTTSYAGASNVNNATILMGRLMRTNDARSMVREGPAASCLRGPLLTDIPYPDVLVAKAFSHGEDLELVLRPGQGSCSVALGFERLRPGVDYDVAGLENPITIRADGNGRARLPLQLGSRVELRLTPRAR
jgi:hypothetical protein